MLMAQGIWVRLKPALLWRYRRGAWQYDVIVALILAFVFLSPRAWFNDRPSRTAVHEIEASADGARVFWMDPSVLDGTAPNASSRRLQEVLRERSGEDLTVVRTETAKDEAGNVRAYLVYARN